MRITNILPLFGFLILIFPMLGNCDQPGSEVIAQTSPAGGSAAHDPVAKPVVWHHRIRVVPDVAAGSLTVHNTIALPAVSETSATRLLRFNLNSAFTVRHQHKQLTASATAEGVSTYQVQADENGRIELNYQGRLASTPDCAWRVQACVLLNQNGIFLDASSHWYPQSANVLHQFSLQVELPEGWVSLSQGQQTRSGWQEEHPQRAIYLLAGPFRVYESAQPGKPTALVYLQQDDPELAQRYLQATHQYLDEYSRLIGEYPYTKFVTVESFWETGWGMPSFTLLGSRVMRLPFILHTSFPHEILHNWWGNSVYVDSGTGNWSEGLTAYLADHRRKRMRGEGMNYRRDTLQKYAAFATAGGDFPLSQFRSRHNRATQAVGYGKSLMLFHMLRQHLGDVLFFQGLRQFYQRYQFNYARFTDLQLAFEQVSGQKLEQFFRQWLMRSGAPRLTIKRYQLAVGESDVRTLEFTVQQTQSGKPFELQLPLFVEHQSGHRTQQFVTMTQAEQAFEVGLPAAVSAVQLDPEFDVFRVPARREVPPALNVLFNREPKTFVLARQLPEGMELAWDDFIETFFRGKAGAKWQYDDEAMPDSKTVVLLGGDNAMLTGLLERAQQPFKLTEAAYTLNSVNYTCGLHSLALTLQAGEQQIVLLDASTPRGLRALARKLPHYGRYSYVLFNSGTGENVAKGQWEVKDSPLRMAF